MITKPNTLLSVSTDRSVDITTPTPTYASPTLCISWSHDGWEDVASANGYEIPLGSLLLPGKNLCEKLTLFLDKFFHDAADIVETNSGDECIKQVASLTEVSLDILEAFVVDSIAQVVDHHQLVHIQELTNNTLRTIIVFSDYLYCQVDQLSSTTLPDTFELNLHPDLCGLLLCGHIFETSSTHQGPRVPYSPHRTGREITYEEIANLYRTSRVNIRRLEIEKCRPKLKCKLRDFR